MILSEAEAIARRCVETLRPYCDRIEIAGSIRRRKPEPGDIEIVAIPNGYELRDMLEEVVETGRDPRFAPAVESLGTVLKGNPHSGRFIQVALPEGITLDLFLATPENWGLIFAMRTGPAEYSHRVLACGWVMKGYHSIDGMLCTVGHKVPVHEEEDLFNLIGVPWIPPEDRIA